MFEGAALKAIHWCRYQGVSWNKIHIQLLGALAKLRKATIIIVMSVRPSVRPSVLLEELSRLSTGMDFHEIWYLSMFRILCEALITFMIPL